VTDEGLASTSRIVSPEEKLTRLLTVKVPAALAVTVKPVATPFF
jgi:hypothetical protein